MTQPLPVLRKSVEHLRSVIQSTTNLDPTVSAYPTEWSIADTMSHIGSGAVILKQRLEDSLSGSDGDATFNQSVWDEWNAKAPADQVRDGLVADHALLEAFESVPAEQRATFHLTFGPFDLDFDGFVALRLGEQALHTWDIEVALDPSARLSSDVAEVVLQGLGRLVGFTGKANGRTKEVRVRTTGPVRDLTIVFAGDSVSLVSATHTGAIDLELPAEEFVRLVYGRLDAQEGNDTLEELRTTFPGF
ncbi:MAG: maleylpyruvate isomerase family mycothiol-dependent enzyme [Acidimicrobiales bacterium]